MLFFQMKHYTRYQILIQLQAPKEKSQLKINNSEETERIDVKEQKK